MLVKVVKWGNSLGLRIPKAFADHLQVSDGTMVDIMLENGRIAIRAVPQPAVTLDELLAGITESNLHGEIPTGGPVGREVW